MPNSVLEALAWGLPVILSDIPAHREILEFCTESGLVYPPGDIDALAASVRDFVVTDTAIRASRKIAVENLNSDLMVSHYEDLYRQIV